MNLLQIDNKGSSIDKDLERVYLVQLILERRRLSELIANRVALRDNIAALMASMESRNPSLSVSSTTSRAAMNFLASPVRNWTQHLFVPGRPVTEATRLAMSTSPVVDI